MSWIEWITLAYVISALVVFSFIFYVDGKVKGKSKLYPENEVLETGHAYKLLASIATVNGYACVAVELGSGKIVGFLSGKNPSEKFTIENGGKFIDITTR